MRNHETRRSWLSTRVRERQLQICVSFVACIRVTKRSTVYYRTSGQCSADLTAELLYSVSYSRSCSIFRCGSNSNPGHYRSSSRFTSPRSKLNTASRAQPCVSVLLSTIQLPSSGRNTSFVGSISLDTTVSGKHIGQCTSDIHNARISSQVYQLQIWALYTTHAIFVTPIYCCEISVTGSI